MADLVSANQRLGGVNFLSIDGTPVLLRRLVSWSPSGPVATSLAGQDGIHGYTEAPTVGHIEAECSDYLGNSVRNLIRKRNASVITDLANGKTVMARQCWNTRLAEVNGDEGMYSVRFESGDVRES